MLAGLALVLGAMPLLVTRPAPLQDWPNHLARVTIEAALLRGDSFWRRFYELPGFAVPNAALDLGVLGLHAAGLPMPVAGQAFLLLTYAAFVTGCLALARALAAGGPEKPALAVLLFYAHPLFWGLVSYVLGIALMLWLIAAWLGRGPSGRLLVALAAVPLMFVHIVAAVAFGVVLGCFDVARLRRPPRRLAHCLSAPVALGTVALTLWLLPSGAGGLRPGYAGTDPGGWVLWKLRIFATVPLGGGPWQDGTALLAVLVAGAVLLPGARYARARGALVAAGLGALVLAAPERLGEGSLLDLRLAWLAVLWVAVALRPPRLGRAALAALLLATGLRVGVLAGAWREAGAVFARYAVATEALPAGAVMMMGYGTPLQQLTWREVWSPPIQSVAAPVVARGVFFPAVFANPAQQPLARRPAWDALAQPWDLTSDAAIGRAAAALAPLCAGGALTGVYLTVLYPGPGTAARMGAALLRPDPAFLLLDACRLPGAG